jgi:hypothetical protein
MEGARQGYLGLAEDDWSGRRVEVGRVAGELRDRVAGLV